MLSASFVCWSLNFLIKLYIARRFCAGGRCRDLGSIPFSHRALGTARGASLHDCGQLITCIKTRREIDEKE